MRNVGNQLKPYPKFGDLKFGELFMFNYVRDQVYVQVWGQVNDQVSNQIKRNLKLKKESIILTTTISNQITESKKVTIRKRTSITRLNL